MRRDDFPWGFVSTAAVTDGARPFETAVEHAEYNGGSMTADELPAALTDCGNSEIQQMCNAFGDDATYPRVPSADSQRHHRDSPVHGGMNNELHDAVRYRGERADCRGL